MSKLPVQHAKPWMWSPVADSSSHQHFDLKQLKAHGYRTIQHKDHLMVSLYYSSDC